MARHECKRRTVYRCASKIMVSMKKNPNTTLAGSSLPRRDTALPEVDSTGEVIGSPDRGQQGWIEGEHSNRVTGPVPSTVLVTPEQLRKLSESADCSVGWLVRRAINIWLESADAKGLKGPNKDGR